MAVKLTKNEQKKQKDSLKQYQRFLPTLQLKKKQLQSVIKDYQNQLQEKSVQLDALRKSISSWVAVYGENPFFAEGIEKFIVKKTVRCSSGNIAGVDIPVFEEMVFEDVCYSLFDYPLWVDRGIEAMKDMVRLDAETAVLNKSVSLLEQELRTTSQRVNLFEKVKIPETQENIRKIAVALQDQQTAGVVRGKIAKKKLTGAAG